MKSGCIYPKEAGSYPITTNTKPPAENRLYLCIYSFSYMQHMQLVQMLIYEMHYEKATKNDAVKIEQ